MTQPLPAYQQLVDEGTLTPDPEQRQAAILLAELSAALKGYRPGRSEGLFRRHRREAPKGVYLWGGVGVGKSLLMDLFVENAPVAARRRVHFHAFMQEVHSFMTQWRGLSEAERKSHPARHHDASLDDPIPHAAQSVFNGAHLFCFDEFQVSDVADAMILGRLFETLFELGAVIVATSNRRPDELYKNGINRQLFMPFIEMIERHLTVQHLVGIKDYRLDRLQNQDVYFYPLNRKSDDAMNASWRAMTTGAVAERAVLRSGSREISVPCAARGTARGTFDHWCASTHGAKDYLLLAADYPTVFIDHIPQMSPDLRNEAKRFVTLIDALYEARCTLFCSAEVAPEDLYPTGDGSFEFERTVSRLREMQSEAYLGLEHVGPDPEQSS
ncbi:cell division protein ZapE [Parvularcula sp. LCG005]|uniref:cell division protein ZapE n=1 Tax=Parvularcula sp. LCG005 TaxID=3078805 RepID=UPI0029433281|nr:cell division protein ZapE [Parvularcula sp. LCG005]WOI53209.1 cell division protein ZapE [Parvularcula sp. LCG005]